MNTTNDVSLLNMETKRGRVINTLIFPVIIAVAAVIMNLFVNGALLTGNNLQIIVNNCVANAFVAWGISYIWSSGPDFSSAAAMMLAAQVGGLATVNLNLGYFGMFAGAILACIGLQLFSTFVRIKLKLPVWVIGLAMCLAYESIGVMYSDAMGALGQEPVTLTNNTLTAIVQMPWIFILFGAGFVFMMILYNRTSFGMKYRAVSSNPTVAGFMGIKPNKTIYIGVAIGAALLGVAAALTMIYSTRVIIQSSLGSFGTIYKGLCAWLLSAGMDKKMSPPLAIMLSAFLIAVIFNFLTYLGIPQGTYLDTILGCFILVFLVIAGRKKEGEN
jgi:Ribose/xylose/arabinose/galactoside ABC-type transport systems, permease components